MDAFDKLKKRNRPAGAEDYAAAFMAAVLMGKARKTQCWSVKDSSGLTGTTP